MPRRTVVDKHPKKKEIERKLASGEKVSVLSKQYGIHREALRRYKQNYLPERVVSAVKKRDITSAEELFQIILKAVRYMEKLADSCDEYLKDPDNPDLYAMGPRAHEIDVVWEEPVPQGDGGWRYVKRRNTLQEIIDNYITKGDIVSLKSTFADPRVLIIKASEGLTNQMDSLIQAYKSVDQGKSSFIGTPAWDKVVRTLLDATSEYPEIRRKIADGLSTITE